MERITDRRDEYLFWKVFNNSDLRTYILSFHTLGHCTSSKYDLFGCIKMGFTEFFIDRFNSDQFDKSKYSMAISLAIRYSNTQILNHIYRTDFKRYTHWMYWIFIEIVLNGSREMMLWYFNHKDMIIDRRFMNLLEWLYSNFDKGEYVRKSLNRRLRSNKITMNSEELVSWELIYGRNRKIALKFADDNNDIDIYYSPDLMFHSINFYPLRISI